MKLASVVAALGLLIAFPSFSTADHGPSEKTFAQVGSVGGHQVPITIYRPVAADADHPVPVLLHSHGWSGSRAKADDAFHNFVAAGFGVVSIDMRGHGDARSTSEARVHHLDFEIADVQSVITYVATLPWVLLDAPGDPRLGALGGSYGGGYQLLAAAVDNRLDALAPEITWNDLPESLAPNGAVKSAWVDVLYAAGNALARVHPDIHKGFLVAQAANRLADGSLPGEPDLRAQFEQSSPATYPTTIDVPTLLIQGMPDTLFNFNQAAQNYVQLKAVGAPVRLFTHLAGHILNTNGTLGNAPFDLGLQPPQGPSPCGGVEDAIIAWYQRHLLGLIVDVGPNVCIALDDGTFVAATFYPVAAPQTFAVGGIGPLVAGLPGLTLQAEVFTTTTEIVIAGIPTITATVINDAADAIIYWTLVVVDGATGASRVVDAQVTPLRVAGPDSLLLDWELGGIGVRLQPGDTLLLVASTSNEQFAHNGGRTAGSVAFLEVELTLPVL